MALAVIQVLVGVFRPSTDRHIAHSRFAVAHRWFGRILIIIGFLIIPFGICTYNYTGTMSSLPQCVASDSAVLPYLIVYGIYIIVLLAAYIILEIITKRKGPYEELKN